MSRDKTRKSDTLPKLFQAMRSTVEPYVGKTIKQLMNYENSPQRIYCSFALTKKSELNLNNKDVG